MELEVTRKSRMFETFSPPADKSLTHRSLLFASIAKEPSLIINPLDSEDALATQDCLMRLGTRFENREEGITVYPCSDWAKPQGSLPCGNSGTTARLLSGLLASRPLQTTLTGDESLSKRPMDRIAIPLRQMGAFVEGSTLPIKITGRDDLNAIDYKSPVASAQVKSCILLAGLRANGITEVEEHFVSRDHSERMLRAMGAKVESKFLPSGCYQASIEPNRELNGFEWTVPADISSAAFFIVAGLILGKPVVALRVGINPTRSGLLDVLEQIGARVSYQNEVEELGEPFADIVVEPSGLKPFEIKGSLVPRLIDEIPILAILATQLNGTSVVRDASELRKKESDRIKAIALGLTQLGVEIETFEDGFAISGPQELGSCHVNANGDHRIAMSFAIAGLICSGKVLIEGAETISTSYPNFIEELERIKA